MIDIQVLMWSTHVWVLGEEGPGVRRRLTGDPFMDDGALPAHVILLGREAYIGTAGAAVSYDVPRARCLPLFAEAHAAVDGVEIDPVSVQCIFLKALDEAVRKRYLHDAIRYTLAIHPGISDEVFNSIRLATWLLDLRDAQIVRLPRFPVIRGDHAGAGDPQSVLLLSLPDTAPAFVGLAMYTGETLSLIDSVEGETPPSHDLAGRAQGTQIRSIEPFEALARSLMSAPASASSVRIFATVSRDGWAVNGCRSDDLRDAEAARWKVLSNLFVGYEPRLQNMPLRHALVAEWGQCGFASRFDTIGGTLIESATGLAAKRVMLEDLALAYEAPRLAADTSLWLGTSDGAVADEKMLAPRQASLPFRSEHILYLRHASSREIQYRVQRQDQLTSRSYSFASGSLTVSGQVHRNSAVKLSVTCQPCGMTEIDFEIPDACFQETVVVDAMGRTVTNPRARHAEVNKFYV